MTGLFLSLNDLIKDTLYNYFVNEFLYHSKKLAIAKCKLKNERHPKIKTVLKYRK